MLTIFASPYEPVETTVNRYGTEAKVFEQTFALMDDGNFRRSVNFTIQHSSQASITTPGAKFPFAMKYLRPQERRVDGYTRHSIGLANSLTTPTNNEQQALEKSPPVLLLQSMQEEPRQTKKGAFWQTAVIYEKEHMFPLKVTFYAADRSELLDDKLYLLTFENFQELDRGGLQIVRGPGLVEYNPSSPQTGQDGSKIQKAG